MEKRFQLKCNHLNTILYCRDFDKALDFYQNVLNLKINFKTDWFVEFHLTKNGYLSIADGIRKTTISLGNCDCMTLSFQVKDLKQKYDYFRKMGIQVSKIKSVWNEKSFFIHDPEGHRIEFWDHK